MEGGRGKVVGGVYEKGGMKKNTGNAIHGLVGRKNEI